MTLLKEIQSRSDPSVDKKKMIIYYFYCDIAYIPSLLTSVRRKVHFFLNIKNEGHKRDSSLPITMYRRAENEKGNIISIDKWEHDPIN